MQLLETKFFPPPIRSHCIPRARLHRFRKRLTAFSLTLVSAPAGFGKSTLVAEWLSQSPTPTVWLQLDQSEHSEWLFFRYVTSALNRLPALDCTQTMTLLQNAQPPPMEQIITQLVNELAAASSELLLVLDDYHLVDNPTVDQHLGQLIEHSPPSMHWIICTREDPNLPLARWRGKSRLQEIRARDLRFSEEETQHFFQNSPDVSLAQQDLLEIQRQTEGWVTGLQLMALALQQTDQPTTWLHQKPIAHHFLSDYLISEVVRQLPENTQHFLTITAELQRFNADLCNAVLLRKDSQTQISSLEQQNIFVVPLDGQRHWYRFHHLFATVLRAQSTLGKSEKSPYLLRAAEWFEQQQLPLEAIAYTLQAEAWHAAVRCIEKHWPTLREHESESHLLDWISQIPPEILQRYPVVSGFVGLALLSSDPNEGKHHLAQAKLGLELLQKGSSDVFSSNPLALAALPGILTIADAYVATMDQLPLAALEAAERALDLLPARETVWLAAAGTLVALVYWHQGQLSKALQCIQPVLENISGHADVSAAVSISYLTSRMQMAAGQLSNARATCEKALNAITEKAIPQGAADLWIVLGEYWLETDQLSKVEEALERAKQLGMAAQLLESRHEALVLQARLASARKDQQRAQDYWSQAEQLWQPNPIPNFRPIAAWKAYYALQQKPQTTPPSENTQYGANESVPYTERFAYLLWLEHQIRLHPSRWADHEKHLKHLLNDVQQSPCVLENIWVDILFLRLRQQPQHLSERQDLLEKIGTLSLASGYILAIKESAFLCEQIRSHFAATAAPRPIWLTHLHNIAGPQNADPLQEPLSDREREVLQLLDSDLSGPVIAEQLFISLNTFRTHSKNLYAKLGVSSRRAAIDKAKALGLIPTTQP